MSELCNKVIKFENGLVIDDRLRVGGLLWLEEKYGKPFGELKFDATLPVMIDLVMALAIQRDPDADESELRKLAHGLDIDELTNMMSKLQIFKKKVPRPAKQKKKATRKR